MANKALEWETMVREVKRLRSQNESLTLALEEIANPLAILQRRAALNNEKLNSSAYDIANSPAHLQDIARNALRESRQ